MAKRKCYKCGKELQDLDVRGLEYNPLFKNSAGSYHLCGRMKLHGKWCLMLSEQEDYSQSYSRPHPLCPACFLAKLRRAVVALETALEGKGIDPDDTQEAEQKPEEHPKKPEIVVPSAEEIKRDYPEWVARVTKAHNGVPLEGESLRDIFRMQRRSGCV